MRSEYLIGQRPSALQVFASLVHPVVLEARSSTYSGELQVRLLRGKLRLEAPNVNYSFGELHDVMDAAFQALGIADRKIERTLMLGYGAGSAAELLLTRDAPNSLVTGVDIDPVVFELAMRWFVRPWSNRVRLYCEDAVEHVRDSKEKYDLIIIDIFHDEIVPAECEHPDFLQHCRALLNPGGLLMINRLANGITRQQATVRFEYNAEKALPGCRVVPVLGNRIVVYERGPASRDQDISV